MDIKIQSDGEKRIVIVTKNNPFTLKLLQSFFEVQDNLEDNIKIKYEDVDQIPMICRLLVEENIDILQIFIQTS